jgi:DNA polymerase V
MNTRKIAVSTRFHSWADNDFSLALDLNELVVKHPAATFFIQVKDDTMTDQGVNPGDIVVVDRALSISNHRIIVARLEGQLIIKKVLLIQGQFFLVGNDHQQPVQIHAEQDFEVWGVVTYIIRKT